MVTLPHIYYRNCGERVHGVSGERFGLGCRGGEGSCGKTCGVGGGVGKCVGVWGEVRKDVWGVEKCGRVYEVCQEVCWREQNCRNC